MIKCEHISKTFSIKTFLTKKQIYALKGLSIEIPSGKITSIIGLNGAGKSTLILILIGVLFPDEGEVKYSTDKIFENIGYMPETAQFPLNLSPYDILSSMKKVFKNINDKKIIYICEKVGLKEFIKKPLKTFSKGMLQRFNLAQCIIHEPEILILDEPFTGLDPLGRKLFLSIFSELKDNGTTMLFSSHILEDVEKISDKIAVIHNGKIVRTITPEECKKKNLNDIFFETISSDNNYG